MPLITKDIKQIFLTASLCAVSITIPLTNNYNSIALIVFVIACIVQQPLKQSATRLGESKLWVIPALYVLLLILSYFWDASGGYKITDLERYSIFLFIPPAMAILPSLTTRQLRLACMSFVAVTTAVSLICLMRSYAEYESTGDYRVFYYHYMAGQMELNAVFLSNYCLASISWLMYFAFIDKKRLSALSFIAVALTGIFLFVMLFLLSSKLIISLTLVVLMIFLLYIGWLRGRLMLSLGVFALVIAAGIFASSRLYYLAWRIESTEWKVYSGKEDENNGLAIRLFMWKTAVDLAVEKPVTGYGIRGAKQKVLEKYKENNFELGYREGYHSHNQFLQTTLMVGVVGLLLLLSMLGLIAREAIRRKNLLLLLLLGHFMIQSLVESTFEVQQELTFYMFFLFLFYYHPPPPKTKF